MPLFVRNSLRRNFLVLEKLTLFNQDYTENQVFYVLLRVFLPMFSIFVLSSL